MFDMGKPCEKYAITGQGCYDDEMLEICGVMKWFSLPFLLILGLSFVVIYDKVLNKCGECTQFLVQNGRLNM